MTGELLAESKESRVNLGKPSREKGHRDKKGTRKVKTDKSGEVKHDGFPINSKRKKAKVCCRVSGRVTI